MRYRKFSPVDRKHPIYELCDGDTVLMDVSKNNADVVEVAFHKGLINRVLTLDALEQVLLEGKALAERGS